MSDFVIENGVLKEYIGNATVVTIPEGVTSIGNCVFTSYEDLVEIIIPEGVTSIGDSVFDGCKNLRKITLPQSLSSIGNFNFGSGVFGECDNLEEINFSKNNLCGYLSAYSFYNYKKLKSIIKKDEMSILDSILLKYHGSEKIITIPNGITTIVSEAFYGSDICEITIPEGVTSIMHSAFAECNSLRKITFPKSIIYIDEYAFRKCDSLREIIVPDGFTEYVISSNTFQRSFPKELLLQVKELYSLMTENALKKYLLKKTIFKKLKLELQCEIFLNRQADILYESYREIIEKPNTFGREILKYFSKDVSVEICNAAAEFMRIFVSELDSELLQKFFEMMQSLPNATQAIEKITKDVSLVKKLQLNIDVEQHLTEAEQMLLKLLLKNGKSVKVVEMEIESEIDKIYGLSDFQRFHQAIMNDEFYQDMALKFGYEKIYKDEISIPPLVLKWMLLKRENKIVCSNEKKIISRLDADSLQKSLMLLLSLYSFYYYAYIYNEHRYIFSEFKNLFYPICRYGDEVVVSKFINTIPKQCRKKYISLFYDALMYSDTQAAVLFFEKKRMLDQYAQLRGMDVDTFRDLHFSNLALDKKGGKSYDLGNQTVTVRLQKDLSFLVELENGKTAKSIPKKGADIEKYEIANADFKEMKKRVKKIVKNRNTILFDEFLSGRTRIATNWKKVYENNPLLRMVASLLVWTQDKNTFLLTEDGAITSNGSSYTITDNAPIALAHPMEMEAEDVRAWQKYFTSHVIKQPFAQIWEPVVDLTSIKRDRYAGCMIPYYYFIGKEKHGITVTYSSELTNIDIKDCSISIRRIDYGTKTYYGAYPIEANHRFEIESFSIDKPNRQANHIVTYLDRVTIYNRIRQDDVTILPYLPSFTLAQIFEFINIAIENKCINVTATLLEYKENNFADFDPMDEFLLEL